MTNAHEEMVERAVRTEVEINSRTTVLLVYAGTDRELRRCFAQDVRDTYRRIQKERGE